MFKKEKGNIFKTIVSMMICVSVITNTNAAIVSDNDGSAFVTKAEYDSLKSEFQSTLNSYNRNIDTTIDSAISSYLEGANSGKEITMSALIDKDGVYGNKIKLKWSSNTNFRMREAVWPKAVQKTKLLVAMGILQYDPTTHKILDTSTFEGGVYDWGLRDGEGNQVTNYDYGTYKIYRVETVKIKTTYYRMLRFVKVVDYFEVNQLFGFPNNLSAASHGGVLQYNTANILELNINNMIQQNLVRGQQVDYHRYWAGSSTYIDYYNNPLSQVSVLKTGNVMITQEYEDENEHVYAPFSNIQEYVWDPNSIVPIAWEDQYQCEEIYASGNVWWTGDTDIPTSVLTEPCRHFHPRKLYFGWQYLPFKSGERNESGDDIEAKDSIIYNYYAIDDRNRAQKNGLALGKTPIQNNAEVICKCASDVDGTVYFYVGKDPIENWTSGSFTGKKYNLTSDGKEVTCTLGKCPSETNIWVLFKPDSTSDKGKLKVNRLYYISS